METCRVRALGSLVGLAVGDAIGTTLEFKPRDSYPPLTDMIGGGPFHLAAGQWTDDTAMALALGDSLRNFPHLEPDDLMMAFLAWRDSGRYSCTHTCFDIGLTTLQALEFFRHTHNPIAGRTDPESAGNGSLMRLAPVAIRHWRDRETLDRVAALQSRTTHGAPEAVDACRAYASILADAIAGASKNDLLEARLPRDGGNWAGEVATVIAGSWATKSRDEIKSTGYVVASLEAALWCFANTATFAEAVLLAANLGDDADTVAAITGQLAGAHYGLSGIPEHWRERLAMYDLIELDAGRLFDAGEGPA